MPAALDPSQYPSVRVLRRPLESALAALIGVVDQTGVGLSARDRHVQCVDDEIGAHVIGDAPADDPAAVGVLDGDEV
jgi:hypothetical protein